MRVSGVRMSPDPQAPGSTAVVRSIPAYTRICNSPNALVRAIELATAQTLIIASSPGPRDPGPDVPRTPDMTVIAKRPCAPAGRQSETAQVRVRLNAGPGAARLLMVVL